MYLLSLVKKTIKDIPIPTVNVSTQSRSNVAKSVASVVHNGI